MRCSLEICHSSTFISVCFFPSSSNMFFSFNLVTFMLVAFGKNQKEGLSRTRTRLEVRTSFYWKAERFFTYTWHALVCTLQYTLARPANMHLTYRHVLCTDIFIFPLICSHTNAHVHIRTFHSAPDPPQVALRSQMTGTFFIRKDGCSLLKYLLSIIQPRSLPLFNNQVGFDGRCGHTESPLS